MSSSETPLWQWQALCAACNRPTQTGPAISGISIDSRTLAPGDLFIALSGDPGPRFHTSGSSGRDGHDFVKAAEQAGAAAVMISRHVDTRLPVLQVDNTLDGLWQLAAARRAQMHGKVVAITGSSGKTTARQWLEQLLRIMGKRVHASAGSLNNHWGVPLSLARMPRGSEFGVFEIGTNNPGEIAPLSRLVIPHVAVVLNVLPAHLGRFANLEAIRQEKLSIESGLATGGMMVVPVDLPHADLASSQIVTFGTGSAPDVAGQVVYGPDYAEVEVTSSRDIARYRLPATGEHRVLTSIAICAVLEQLGIALRDAAPAFSKLTVPRGRGNTLQAAGVIVVDDSYNANPVSMRYALQALSGFDGQKVAILGEMLELGDDGIAMHQEIAEYCGAIDGIITVGHGFADWPPGKANWGHFDTAAQIDVQQVAERIKPGGCVLVKGSNKVFWTHRFVDRLVDALKARG